ncbi:MAG: glycosyl transferase family 90 [Acidimicrobiales bacterium]
MIIHAVDEVPPVQHKLVLWKRAGDGLHALSLNGFQTRHEAVLALVDPADQQHNGPAFGPVLIHTDDRPIGAIGDDWRSYAFCTAPGYLDVAVPDFVFGGWPEVGIDDFDDTAASMAAAGDQPAELAVAGWIGSCGLHPVRSALLRLSEAHPDLLDVHDITWVYNPSGLQTVKQNHLSLPEQVRRWNALVDVEGKGYSGRLKLLLHSGRPVLVQDRPWHEWYWDSLVPMKHYIPVRRDLSDLLDRARWVQQNPQEAVQIGRAGQKLAQRLLTRASAVDEWGRVLSVAGERGTDGWAPQALREDLGPVLPRLGAS